MNTQDKLAEALNSLRLKFTSGNDVPVPEARITRAEWEAIEQAHAAQAQPPANTEKLAELLRGLEIGPMAATLSPKKLFAIGAAIAAQAKEAQPPAASVPDAMQEMVPKEPTHAMRESAASYGGRGGYNRQRGDEAMEVWRDMLAAAPQPQAAESHKGLLIGTTPSGVPYSLHGTKESVTAVSDMLKQAEVSRQLGADQPQSAEPVAVIESAEDRHGPYLTHANVVLRVWNGYAPKAGDEIYTHPQPAQDAKDAARYQWWRANGYLALANGECLDTNEVLFAGTEMDEYTDAAMARESGR